MFYWCFVVSRVIGVIHYWVLLSKRENHDFNCTENLLEVRRTIDDSETSKCQVLFLKKKTVNHYHQGIVHYRYVARSKPWKLWLHRRAPVRGSRDVRVWYLPSFHSKTFRAHGAWYKSKACLQKQKEMRSTIKGAASVRLLYPFRVMNRRITGSDYTCWPQYYI